MRYDLAIAGAGPAGSTLALLAARAGMRVLLLERTRFERERIGETAPPELRPLLANLELGHLLNAANHTPAPAVVSIWGSAAPMERHHITSPYGAAVHLDRRAFDEALAFAAAESGADLRLAARATFERRRAGGYDVATGRAERASATLAVLATGRATGGSGLPYRRTFLDDHIAVAGRFARVAQGETRTVIEAVTGGWFYLATIPGDRMIAVFITSRTAVPADKTRRLRWWSRALASTCIVRSALSHCAPPETVSVHHVRASHAATGAGKDWFAIGDARLAPDPLSGQGILWALEDARFAARLLSKTSHGGLARQFAERTAADVADYRRTRARVYAMEQRFGADPFWAGAGSSMVGATGIEPVTPTMSR